MAILCAQIIIYSNRVLLLTNLPPCYTRSAESAISVSLLSNHKEGLQAQDTVTRGFAVQQNRFVNAVPRPLSAASIENMLAQPVFLAANGFFLVCILTPSASHASSIFQA